MDIVNDELKKDVPSLSQAFAAYNTKIESPILKNNLKSAFLNHLLTSLDINRSEFIISSNINLNINVSIMYTNFLNDFLSQSEIYHSPANKKIVTCYKKDKTLYLRIALLIAFGCYRYN